MKNLFPIIFTAIAVAVLFIFVRPMYKDISTLRASVSAYDTALTHSTELQKTRDSLVASYNGIAKENKERIAKFLPNTVDNIQLILEIQQIAGNHGMSIKNIDFTPPQTEEKSPDGRPVIQTNIDPSTARPYGTFDLEFKTEAKYENMVAFLKDLEENLRLVDVVSINFTVPPPDRENGDPDLYEYDLKLNTYWLKH